MVHDESSTSDSVADAMPAAVPRSRWYHLTPDRFLVGLLAAEAMLLLADRFSFFGLETGSGWNVLLAIALVAGGMLIGLLWCAVSLALRRRFQFSLRSLLVLTFTVALVCSWYAVKKQRATRQQELVATIEERGWHVFYDYQLSRECELDLQEPPGPTWLRDLFGEHFFVAVRYVALLDDFDQNELLLLRELHGLKGLQLCGTQLTNAGLANLTALTQLEVLDMSHTSVTDAGLVHLRELPKLRRLAMLEIQITDAGLKHLQHLTDLRDLYLGGTQITGNGMEHLSSLVNLRSLDLEDTQVTDHGMKHLSELTHLRWLSLDKTLVTGDGLRHIKNLTDLEVLTLSVTQIDDVGIQHLKKLPNLRKAVIRNTRVIFERIDRFRKTLPDCEIVHREGERR